WDEQLGAAGSGRSVTLRLSASQLRTELIDALRSATARTGVDPRVLRFGIEERALVGNPDLVARVAHGLSTIGAAVEIADVGTASSPLELWHRLPIDTLGIHPTLVRDLTDSGSRPRAARTVIALARAMEIGVLARGIETREQAIL